MYEFVPNNFNPLYFFLEAYKAQLAPFRFAITNFLEMNRNNNNPFYATKINKTLRAFLEMTERITRDYKKLPFGINECVVDKKIYKVDTKTLLAKPFCHLLHFVKEDFKTKQPKLLIIAPMAGHNATLLRGTIQDILPFFDVYVTDWVNANQVPLNEGKFDMDDFIDYVIEFIKTLKEEVNVMAVCQPTVPVLAAVSIMSAANDSDIPKSMILIGGPVDASKNPTVVNSFATAKSLEWFEKMVITTVPANFPGHGRRVFPGFLQLSGFISINPERHMRSHIEMFKDLMNENIEKAERQKKFYDEYFAVMDLPAEFYLQTIKEVFQNFSLARGVLISRGRHINPASITKCALLGIEGEHDDIAGIGQTQAALNLCTNIPEAKKKYHFQKGVGHYGVFSGSKFRESIVPAIKNFIYNPPT